MVSKSSLEDQFLVQNGLEDHFGDKATVAAITSFAIQICKWSQSLVLRTILGQSYGSSNHLICNTHLEMVSKSSLGTNFLYRMVLRAIFGQSYGSSNHLICSTHLEMVSVIGNQFRDRMVLGTNFGSKLHMDHHELSRQTSTNRK